MTNKKIERRKVKGIREKVRGKGKSREEREEEEKKQGGKREKEGRRN